MLQLDNRTPFAAGLNLFPNEQGIDTLYLVVKASFNIGRELTLADEQTPLLPADVFYGDPETTSMKYASDFHLGKPGTDVVMNGFASAAQGQSVRELDVSLQVGQLRKTIRVFGDRQWVRGSITRPEPFATMPLVYEKAYGGVSLIDGEIESADPRNPVGCGYLGARDPEAVDGMPLPNLEDPAALIRSPKDSPVPAGFGFVCPGWSPRINYCGTYDDEWQQSRAPFLPLDFDSRFFHMAHPDLVSSSPLRGGEEISIDGMHPRGRIECRLPEISLKADLRIDGQTLAPAFRLETVLLEPNQLKLEMTWRSAHECDKKALRVESARITMRR
jgi:hypothetical protein